VPVVHAADAVVHELHGSVFASYAAPATGSHELCAWRLEVPAGSNGVPHTVSREEILLVLDGTLQVTLTGGAESGGGVAPGATVGPDGDAGPGGEASPGGDASPDEAPGKPVDATSGDVIVVPAGAVLRIDNPGAGQASAWVTTSVGLEAVLPDGSRIQPPWVR
jgi:mannose-6-phosphate isomerase-like protein (cupin superfamily)